MKKLPTLLILLGCMSLWSQDTFSDPGEIEALIEGNEVTQTEVSLDELMAKLNAKTDKEKQLIQNAFEYWNACHKSDWIAAYQFYWKPFQEIASQSNYLNWKKNQVTQFEISRFQVDSEECAVVIAHFGIYSPMMEIKRIRAKQYWHYEEGTWRLVADPYANPMGIRPHGSKKIDFPCGYLERSSSKM